ncbi:PBSX family phage terminase large subunit [Periweissella cryptocerci]|uniref:PBSX family phage terminase large subunit n=1 Tax=Periweissella cryptocerci TaxID=2506420 RepID=A0A4P6YVV7_9LACO|nr:PBSX family phage terminase large subunit [Periweissella cryptocerci]QBO36962.1 PBSX family phage terminase large subunit [Periweissella cryptocerci]
MTFTVGKEVNPHFKRFWEFKDQFNILKGGRNSFKSSVVAMRSVKKMLAYVKQDETANVIVIRKTGKSLRDSVYKKIQWAIKKFDATDQFDFQKSPLMIQHKSTGSTFYFYGHDDYEKLKSNDVENVIVVWFEESAEFKNEEEFDQTESTFMRQKHPLADFVRFIWTYNPPRNPYSWINKWASDMKTTPGWYVDESTYLDDVLGFVTDDMLRAIENIKIRDIDYYRYLYLGEAVGLGTNVWNMDFFHIVDAIPNDDDLLYILMSADIGHQQSATAVSAYGYSRLGRVYLLDTYYYSPAGKVVKKAPSELSQEVHEFEERVMHEFGLNIWKRTIDSAEGGFRNQYYLDFHIRWDPVNKALTEEQMTDYAIDLLGKDLMYIINRGSNDIFVTQQQNYRWDIKTVEAGNPKVIKEDDHTSDNFRYMARDNAKLLGLQR